MRQHYAPTEILRFILYAVIIYLTGFSFDTAVAETTGNGTHFCGVIDCLPDKQRSAPFRHRRYARSFAANCNVGEPRTVRMIYFLPNDRPYQADVVQRMKDMIPSVQTFFGEQMEAHGYGKRTFRVETDAQGEPIVHRVDGRHPDNYYLDYTAIAYEELTEIFNYQENIYLTTMDNSTNRLSRHAAGAGTRYTKQGGEAMVVIGAGPDVVAHELGHAFGLQHDFNDGEYIMSYGPARYRNGVLSARLSECHAASLSVHTYFNSDSPLERGDPPTIKLISPRSYPPGSTSVPFRIQVSDPDGLHQVILHAAQPDNRWSVKSHRVFSGERSAIIDFDYDGVIPSAHDPSYSRSTSLLNPLVHPIVIEAVEMNGDSASSMEGSGFSFVLFSETLQSLSKVSGDGQHGSPNTPLPGPFVIEVRNLDDDTPLGGASITFAVTAGGGFLSVQHTVTDDRGRAESTLTLGKNLEMNTVRVSAGETGGAVTFTAEAVATVAWRILNQYLRTEIETALGKRRGEAIRSWEMATLTRLEAQNANISDLTGLERATSLTELYLGAEWVEAEKKWQTSNSVSNLLPLAELTKLTRLDLRGNYISDLSPLAGLTNLTYLELWENRISDLSPLAGLINLTELRLGGNSVSDLSPIAELANLERLLLQNNRCSDLSPLAGLTSLTRLGVANNNISDLSPLAGLTNLATLGLRRNRISDLSPLAGLTNLAKVVLMDNRISDLSSLAANLGLGSGDTVKVQGNPLNYQSIYTHIPTLESRGVKVEFDNRIPTHSLIICGDDQRNIPGTVLKEPLAVIVRDGSSVPFEGVPVKFAVKAGGGSLSATSVTTDSNGWAESWLTLGPNPGTNTVEVSVAEIREKQTFTAKGVRIPKTLQIISGDDQEGLPGAALTQPFVVEVLDDENRPVPGVQVTFSVGRGGGTLNAGSVTTDANGRAQSTLILGANPGSNTVSVSVTGIQEMKTFSAEGIRIPLAFWIISGDKQQGVVGEALANPFVVEVRDQSGEPLADVEVTFKVTGGGGTLSVTSATTDDNGRAESVLTMGLNPETNTAEGIGMPKTLEIVSGGGQQGLPGTALEKAFVVEVKDRANKPLADVEVTFSVKGGGGTLSAGSVATNSSGRAESTLTLGQNPGTNTVTVSVTGIQEEKTFTAKGVQIPKTLEIISGDDQEGLPGAALTHPFVVEVLDDENRPVPGVQVTFAVGSGGGTLSAGSVTTDSNGRAQSNLILGPNPGANTISVSVTGIQEVKTLTAEGIRIPLAFWIISGFDQNGAIGEALAKPFVVEVRDRAGEPLPDAQVIFSVTAGGGMLSTINAMTDSNGRTESVLTLGPNPGRNTVTISVTGIAAEQSVSATAEPPPISEDVNGDDVVNIFDLVSVASNLGDEGAELPADVNGDEVVNILDLVLVAGALGGAAAAPSAWYRDLEIAPTAASINEWLIEARALEGLDQVMKRGILRLENLLAALTPKETALLPNYPNPFNPETWIPYQLAEDANTLLTIYDAGGNTVRRLELGHRQAGYYADRGKAAYWDGCNEFGEQVASGVYFYTLAAGDFTATRKMLIGK